jgi:hypothetical protein
MPYLDEAKAYFRTAGLAIPEAVRPCTEEEVLALAHESGGRLPAAYCEFLLWMGHGGAGPFMRGDDCFYQHLAGLREYATDLLLENGVKEPLPDNAFVFFMHDGYVFCFFDRAAGDDPPVYRFLEGDTDPVFRLEQPSFSKWLLAELQVL